MNPQRPQKRVAMVTHINDIPLPRPVSMLRLLGGYLVVLGLLCLLGPKTLLGLVLCAIGGVLIGASPNAAELKRVQWEDTEHRAGADGAGSAGADAGDPPAPAPEPRRIPQPKPTPIPSWYPNQTPERTKS